MALPNFNSFPDWQDAIEEIHGAHFRRASISIYRPTTGEAVLERRSARIQQQRTPTVVTEAGERRTKRSFLFEIELRESDPIIEEDMLIRVHDGGKDKQLEVYGFTVLNSVNSSEAAIRTIEAATDLAILPRIP